MDEQQVGTTVRYLRRADIPAVVRLQSRARPLFLPWTAGQLESHLRCFPQGQLVAVRAGSYVGACSSIKLRLREGEPLPDWLTATGQGYFHVHAPAGNVLYVASMAVNGFESRTEVRRALDASLIQLAEAERCERILLPVRLPGYVPVAPSFDATEYLARIADGRLPEPVVQALRQAGFQVLGLLPDHQNQPRPGDRLAALLEWRRQAS